MQWSEEHKIMLIREVLLFEPWKYKQGSIERGQVWKRISEALNALEKPAFRVHERSVRDHLNLLMKKFKKKENEEARASGIACEEENEIDKGLRDIVNLFSDHERHLQEENEQRKQKLETEAAQAEELRLNSLETFGQTRKRKSLDSEEESPNSSRKRRSSTDTINYLKEKSVVDAEIRKQELELKKQEIQNMQQFLINQQNQTAQMLQQQQQLNITMLDLCQNLFKKDI